MRDVLIRAKGAVRKLVILVITLFLLSKASFACLIPYSGSFEEVARDLTVAVQFEGRPLAGALVELFPQGLKDRLSKSTGADGIARFSDLEPGRYFLAVRHLEIPAVGELEGHIEVLPRPTTSAKSRLDYRWGGKPIEVRQIAVTITTLESGANVLRQFWSSLGGSFAVDGAEIKLQHAVNGRVFETKSDARGAFAFAGVPSGTYGLRVSGGRYGWYGNFLVRVTPAAGADSLRTTPTIVLCGTGYELVPVG